MISLIHPSRGRPLKARITADKWIYEAGVPVEHIFSLDLSDPHHKAYSQPKAFSGQMLINDNDCVVQAVNHAAKVATGDVLIYLSDDFDCFPNWGKVITEICSRYQGEFMVKVDDGLQKFDNAVLTIPIMSRGLYQRLGYFFHPSYKSMWVDVDLYMTCDRLRPLDFNNGSVIKLHPEICFQHNHYSNGKTKKDETYARSDANWEQGKQALAKRRDERYRV